MATFDNIGLAEPSTITAFLATVQMARGSTTENQEIMCLGDSESSLGIARVLAAAPSSTDWGLTVRQVGFVADSTTVNVSSLAGTVLVSPVSTASVRVAQSSAADLNVTVAGYVAPSTTVNVSSLAGTVLVSPVSTASVRVTQSSAADLNVTVAGYVAPSTTVAVSSLSGRVSFAGFHGTDGVINVTDSTNNAINVNVVAGAAGGSTTVNISSVSGRVAFAAYHAGGSFINVADSTNNAINVNVVAGAAGGSTVMTVSTGSIRVHQSTAADLNVTVAGYVAPSTTVNVSSLAGTVFVSPVSTASVRVAQSSAADLNVTVAGYSTTVNVSSIGGAVIVRSTANTLLATVYQSTAADFLATVTPASGSTWRTNPGSTLWASSAGFHFDSSGGLQVNVVGGSAASTTVNVSSLAGTVFVSPVSTASVIVSTGSFTISRVLDSSGGGFAVGDSVNNAVRVSIISGDTRELLASTVAYGQVTLGSTIVQIVAASTVRARLVVIQHSTINVYLGASTVTSTSGLLLAGVAGNQVIIRHDNALYGVSTGGSPVVSFMHERHA